MSLYEAFLALKSPEEVHVFLKDLCTPQELSSMTERWRICQILHNAPLSYRQIKAEVGASLVTIGRVARFLKEEPYGGYRLLLDRLEKK